MPVSGRNIGTGSSKPNRLPANLNNKKSGPQRLWQCLNIATFAVLLQGASIPISGPTAPVAQKPIQVAVAPPIPLTYPLDKLKQKLMAASDVKKLRTGIFVFDPTNGRYVDMNGKEPFAAASMIKLPILVSLLAAIDRGEVKFDQQLSIRQDLITGGSGYLQYRPVNSKMSVKDTAWLMMVISDNTATNMIIDVLGGKEKCSAEFASWGLAQTRINNMLGDFAGTNKTSPYDLVYLLARVYRGEILSPAGKNWLTDVMLHTKIRTLLNPGLGPGATLGHKTGDIGTMVGDVGMVTAPGGATYFVSIQVERPFNDRRANALIRVLSKGIYPCLASNKTECDDAEVGSLQDEYKTYKPMTVTGRRPHHRRHSRH
ncbi:MAG: class A beta-lactamase-related serine hydrolase [Candidatus Obscuribacterales bacterium]|nr:class A beta-lactamase-related serine hydrolase [Candidatus Obscuribacterales bacterium]